MWDFCAAAIHVEIVKDERQREKLEMENAKQTDCLSMQCTNHAQKREPDVAQHTIQSNEFFHTK